MWRWCKLSLKSCKYLLLGQGAFVQSFESLYLSLLVFRTWAKQVSNFHFKPTRDITWCPKFKCTVSFLACNYMWNYQVIWLLLKSGNNWKRGNMLVCDSLLARSANLEVSGENISTPPMFTYQLIYPTFLAISNKFIHITLALLKIQNYSKFILIQNHFISREPRHGTIFRSRQDSHKALAASREKCRSMWKRCFHRDRKLYVCILNIFYLFTYVLAEIIRNIFLIISGIIIVFFVCWLVSAGCSACHFVLMTHLSKSLFISA